MTLIAKESGAGDFQLAPEGQYAAICHSIIDLGTQKNEYKGEVKNLHQIVIAFELHGENILGDGHAEMEDGQPFVISKFFTLSLAEKANLRPFLENWRGKAFSQDELDGFDVSNLLHKPCMVTVQHKTKANGQVKADITTVSRLLKNIEQPAQVNDSVLFSLAAFDIMIFEGLSTWFREKITLSPEYQGLTTKNVQEVEEQDEDEDSEVPF